MFVKKKKYDELKQEFEDFKQKYSKFEKIINEDYGDSLELMRSKWSELAWLINIPSEHGKELVQTIIEDVRILVTLVKKKEVLGKNGGAKTITK